MDAGELWRQFSRTWRPRLDADPQLARLAAEALSGLHERLLVLMPLLYNRIRTFLHELPKGELEFWYDNPELARRYSGAQVAVVPVRSALAERMADHAWDAIARTLLTQPVAYVLDLGTGDGIMARTLLARRPAEIPRDRIIVVASDRSAQMLEVNAASFAEHGIHTLEAAHGDLRGETWRQPETYQALLGADFNGFAVVMGMMCFHILPERGTHLYPGIAQILRPDGLLVFAHDFFRPGDCWSTYAPTQTLIDGYRQYVATCTTKQPISFVSYLAGFLLRRSVLQGDLLCTLSEETEAVQQTFAYAQSERHEHYHEFAVFTASQREPAMLSPHPVFTRPFDD